MEDSEPQRKILAFGQKIVEELELDPGVDTLAKWMAHFLAEKLNSAELLTGKEKEAAEKECFEIILEIWRHRWSVPVGKPFLTDFEPLFETLKKLNPNRESPFFIMPKIDFNYQKEKRRNEGGTNEVENKFESALSVDRLARSIICQLLHQAVSELKLSNDRECLLRDAVDLMDHPDTEIIRFTTDYDEFEKAQNEEVDDERKERIEKLTKRIKEVEEFDSLKESLLSSYKKELQELMAK
jgi:hypothetical protein